MAYEVVGLLGRGATAVVELALDPGGRPVAIKRCALTGSARQIDQARRRLRREAELLRSLDHPALVPVLDVVDDGSDVVLVLPALAENLEDRVARLGHLAPDELARIGRRLLDGLAAAHRGGVVHRDVKPANVLFDAEGLPALADFGVATSSGVTAGLTGAGAVVGTPTWMPPEQARGEPAGTAGDVFGLAATLVWAGTGQTPYEPGPATAVLARAAA
ncbi:protein kinase, partial [Acidimicrobiaceae bacterium USS-CC1]|nr:protein kinase [Acidiferrimicrobium australe]